MDNTKLKGVSMITTRMYRFFIRYITLAGDLKLQIVECLTADEAVKLCVKHKAPHKIIAISKY